MTEKKLNRYEQLIEDLEVRGKGSMKCHGNSMLPILTNPSINTYQKQDSYEVGDIVFCKVKGRYIDAHLITQKSANGKYMISNNHGYNNGWTDRIFGRVVSTIDTTGRRKNF